MNKAVIKGKYQDIDCTVYLTGNDNKFALTVDVPDNKVKSYTFSLFIKSDVEVIIESGHRYCEGNYAPPINGVFNALLCLREDVLTDAKIISTSGKAFDIPYYGDDVVY